MGVIVAASMPLVALLVPNVNIIADLYMQTYHGIKQQKSESCSASKP